MIRFESNAVESNKTEKKEQAKRERKEVRGLSGPILRSNELILRGNLRRIRFDCKADISLCQGKLIRCNCHWTQRYGGVKEFLLGSIAKNVIDNAHIPALLDYYNLLLLCD